MAYQFPKSEQELRQRLAKWREIFFAQKYRFDLGQSFLVVLNFTLLIITASDKLQIFFGLRLRSLLILIVPLGFIGVWVFGYFMDKVVRAAQMAERQSMKRSEMWTNHNAQMDRMERELQKVKQLLTEQKKEISRTINRRRGQ
ncbi:MAG: hypothetical protein HY088_07450 [Ignavibacteriales bacterium]|nr:hypothetical protein [Ignavibacteriales bacterium]